MIVFSLIFLPLRYWTRWRTFRRFYADDLLALIGWLSALAMGAASIWMVDAMCTSSLPISPSDISLTLTTPQTGP